ncbi:hypothetical protein FQR65_LT00809 [Abscondita terminalis]|nr:hypothetical protein FQR65_LT00809 [Abscondita terminalis]
MNEFEGALSKQFRKPLPFANSQPDVSAPQPTSNIVIEDFDSAKNANANVEECLPPDVPLYQRTQRPYTRQTSDATIKQILVSMDTEIKEVIMLTNTETLIVFRVNERLCVQEEAEHRKHEFWKLIDEHSAVIENLKKIEQLENNPAPCKSSPVSQSIST